MTIVEFYHNAPDRTHAVCVLIAGRIGRGERVRVYAPDPGRAELLDKALWSFSALSFVPHCREGTPIEADTPVIIGANGAPTGGALEFFRYIAAERRSLLHCGGSGQYGYRRQRCCTRAFPPISGTGA